MEYLIDCIVKRPHHDDPHYGIEMLGGPLGAGGERWKNTRQEVINMIREGTLFYTLRGLHQQYVAIAKGEHGEYLHSLADDTPTDNLLHQPTCPGY